MLYQQFQDLYRNKGEKDVFQKIITDVIKLVDYSNTNFYKHDYYENNGNYGVLFNLNNKWIWSWINTINTNNSCIYEIIDYLNSEFNSQLTYELYNKNRDEFFNLFIKYIDERKQIIFTPKSEIFKKMFFLTQMIWNAGLISVMSGIMTIKKFFNVSIDLNFERGDRNDMTKGCDFLIYFEDETKSAQHKKVSQFYLDGDYYTTYNFYYNEKTYRKNLDLITIESNNEIYVFENSYDSNDCSMRNGKFYIHKNQLKKIMKKEKEEITDLLIELNKICFQNKIIFMFEKGEIGNNEFFEEMVGNKKSIRFMLNDLNDENLKNLLEEQINKLKEFSN